MTVRTPPRPSASSPKALSRVDVLGVPVDVLTWESALGRVEEFVAGDRPRRIATANALMLLAAERDPALRDALLTADLVVADSVGVVFAARRQGMRLSRLPGIELMDRLCAEAARAGRRVYLLGAAPGVAQAAADRLTQRHSGLIVAGAADGFFSAEDEPAVVARIAAARPDLLFVALDMSRQELWIHRHLPGLGARVAMGVGGSFDVFAGRLRRAPRWMGALGLEWLFRLAQEPSRLSRMAGLPRFAWDVLRQKSARPD